MNNDKIFDAWTNPLAFLDVDEPWAESGKAQPKLDVVVGFLCAPGVPADLQSLVSRYKLKSFPRTTERRLAERSA